MALAIGTQLGQYEITALLGKGGMGEVYRATDSKLGRSVAIKVLSDTFRNHPDRAARLEREARVLHDRGFRHILLVTGEAPQAVDNNYLAAAAQKLRPLFSSISIEVYPMDEEGYRHMVNSGVDGLTIYQETYDRALYAEMHPFGRKRDFEFRLLAPERGGAAGLRKIGIGSLLGLGNFRTEGFFTGLHALYLSRHYWRVERDDAVDLARACQV